MSLPRPRILPSAPALLSLAGLLLGMAVAGSAAALAMLGRERALADTRRELGNLALVLADRTERAFQGMEVVQAALVERLRMEGVETPEAFRAWAAPQAVQASLAERIAGMPQGSAVSLVDATGRLINASRASSVPPVDLAGQEYFTALRDGAERFLAAPRANHAAGNQAIHLARRVSGPGGELLGVVLGSMEAAYFEGFYGALSLGAGSTVELVRSDGILLARHPSDAPLIGTTIAEPGQYRLALAEGSTAATRLASGQDGRDSLIASRELADYPVHVDVGMTLDAALAGWWTQTAWLAGGTVLLLALIAGAVTAAHRLWQAQAAADEARAVGAEARAGLAEQRLRHERDLAAQHAEFRQVVEGMSLGLCKFSAAGRLSLTNFKSAEIIGYPAALLRPGATFTDIMAGLRQARQASAAVAARLAPLVMARERGSFICELDEGRAAAISHQPQPDGGWLLICEDVTRRRAAEARLEHFVRHDALTGLPNRRLLHERLAAALAAASRSGESFALLCLDLDHFKEVNSTLGHLAADALLQAVGARLVGGLRDGDMVARLDGAKFAMLLTGAGAAQPGSAADVAHRLVRSLSEPFLIEGQPIITGASAGIALSTPEVRDAEVLLRHADIALHRAQQEGQGRVHFFEPGMGASVQARRKLELDLRHALDQQQFELHYQPVVNVRSRAITGFEALVRWRHPERGMIPPADFIPLAEEIGLIVPLGELVLRQACIEAAKWPAAVRVAVNLSPTQFCAPRLVDTVAEALADSGLPPHRLELEITEGVLLQRTDATLATLHRLRALGLRIALDDFGTGYSSLSYLRNFPFDKVKIDRAFVRDLDKRQVDAAIVRAVTGLCRRLGMVTTAEGVETEPQLRHLADENCAEAQGYLFSPARPAAEIPGLLQRLGAQECTAPGRVSAAEAPCDAVPAPQGAE